MILTVLLTGLLVLLVLRLSRSGFDWATFRGTFAHIHWLWVLASAALGLLTYLGRALRWQVMLKPIQPNASLWNVLSATAIGFTAVVLFGRAGEPVRPYLIAVKERVSFSSQLAAWLLERIFDLLTVLIVFGFALTQVNGAPVGPFLGRALDVGGLFVGILGSLSLLLLLLFRQFSGPMQKRLQEALGFLSEERRRKADRLINSFLEVMQVTRSSTAALLLVLYTLVEWGLISIGYVCLFRAFPQTTGLDLADVLTFMGFASFGNLIQVPGVGGGVQLVSAVVLTELFALPLEVASGVAVFIWIITFVVIVPVGLALLFHEGLNWKKLKEIEIEASR